jgi:Capsular polysaccharide biosynthesis protein
VIIPTLLLVGAAIALGTTRAPNYTAETRLTVGRLDVSSQAVPGVVAANQSLAATYSRLVTAEGVVDPVAVRLGLSSGSVARALRASPIPESPIIRLEPGPHMLIWR